MIEKRDVSDKGESPHQIDVHRCGNQHSADFRETVDVRCVYRSQPSGAGERENLKKDRSTDLSGSHEIPDQYQRACHCPRGARIWRWKEKTWLAEWTPPKVQSWLRLMEVEK